MIQVEDFVSLLRDLIENPKKFLSYVKSVNANPMSGHSEIKIVQKRKDDTPQVQYSNHFLKLFHRGKLPFSSYYKSLH